MICFIPPDVALVMAQAASRLVLNSAWPRSWTSKGKMLASITAWIWSRWPAVILDIVQHASFLIDSWNEIGSLATSRVQSVFSTSGRSISPLWLTTIWVVTVELSSWEWLVFVRHHRWQCFRRRGELQTPKGMVKNEILSSMYYFFAPTDNAPDTWQYLNFSELFPT